MNLNSTLWSGTIFALHSYIEVSGCEEKIGYIFNQALWIKVIWILDGSWKKIIYGNGLSNQNMGKKEINGQQG